MPSPAGQSEGERECVACGERATRTVSDEYDRLYVCEGGCGYLGAGDVRPVSVEGEGEAAAIEAERRRPLNDREPAAIPWQRGFMDGARWQRQRAASPSSPTGSGERRERPPTGTELGPQLEESPSTGAVVVPSSPTGATE